MINKFLIIAATWALQGPNDITCTATYGGASTPKLGIDTPYPVGSRVAPFVSVDGDEAVNHYQINQAGKLFHLLNAVPQANIGGFVSDSSADVAIPQEAYALVNQLAALYRNDSTGASAKTCWKNNIANLKFWMTSTVLSKIQQHATDNNMPLQ